ncbi:MAG TPA: iron-sulfur cluster assembly scaffold protein [Pyrinomonadaceae bacterium]|nr:iron-sulfur cluster assembly scaffold protein [Pyrinomonadaceae bacterium]
MSYYPEKITRRFAAPKNAGELDAANATGKDASFVCGCFVGFSLLIDPGSSRITNVQFQTNGCGYMIAAADVLADEVKGRELTELHGSEAKDVQRRVELIVGEFPKHRQHCLATSISALHGAFTDNRSRCLEEFRGEKPLICTCFGVSEDSIEKCITDHQPETAAEVARLCKAGSGCGSCRMLIQEMIDIARVENI